MATHIDRTETTHEFTYEYRVAGRTVAEIDCRCDLTLARAHDYVYVLDATNVQFKGYFNDPENNIIRHEWVSPATSDELTLKSAVLNWLTGVGHERTLDSLDLHEIFDACGDAADRAYEARRDAINAAE